MSIIGCHNCLYSVNLRSFCNFIIQLYDTLSLSFMCIKQLKLRTFMQCKCCYRTGTLPCKLRAVGSIPCLGLDVFFFLSFPPLLSFLEVGGALTARLAGSCAFIWRAFFDHRHSNGRMLCLWLYS